METPWSTAIAPLLAATRPSLVVDLGPAEAELSALLAGEVAEKGTTVARKADLDAGLPAAPEFALIHGDPNWHSVTERLDRVAELAHAAKAPLAVTVVHGVDWPTARRDRYPDPAAIPMAARQPHAAGRPRPGERGLVVEGGAGGGAQWALDEHDQRNGVLTAVEDFLEREDRDLELVHVPGLGGTAILAPAERLTGKGSRALSRMIKGWRLSPGAVAQLAAVEAARARDRIELDALQAELADARAGLARQESEERATLLKRIDDLASRNAELTELLARRDARLAARETSGSP